jgi:hypothetical protein
MCARMTHAGLQSVREHLAALETVLAKSHGGWADEESLLEFRRICWAALLVANDADCQRHLDHLVQYAKDLYSDDAHQRWNVGPVFGADILRRKIRAALGALRARLNGIDRTDAKPSRERRPT